MCQESPVTDGPRAEGLWAFRVGAGWGTGVYPQTPNSDHQNSKGHCPRAAVSLPGRASCHTAREPAARAVVGMTVMVTQTAGALENIQHTGHCAQLIPGSHLGLREGFVLE